MKICIYSPYMPKHVGGGEKYLLDVALSLQDKNDVSIAFSSMNNVSDSEIALHKKKYEDFIGQSLKGVSFISTPLGTSTSFLNKLMWTKNFDCIYYATDGSLFFSLAKKNILHIQVPFTDTKTTIDRFKLSNWHVKNTNSFFTKGIIEKNWKTKIDVVHQPMISNDFFFNDSEIKKEKAILHVGRFFRQLHSKRQDVLVAMFKSLMDLKSPYVKNWKLVMIGSVEDKEYFDEVNKLAKDYPIEIYTNVSRERLIEWYQKASIYWHATGYGVDEAEHPEKVEHFGISTVEAMAAGCVPVVINKGGQSEVVGSGLNDLLWNEKDSCISTTLRLIKENSIMTEYSNLAIQRAKKFTQNRFKKQLLQMLQE